MKIAKQKHRSNIILSFTFFSVFVISVLMSLGVYVSQKFRVSNQQKLQISYSHQLGKEIDDYWRNKLSILDQLTVNSDIVKYLKDNHSDSTVANMLLNAYKSVSAASIVYLMDLRGEVQASSFVGDTEETLIGNEYAFRPYFTRALAGEMVVYPAVGVTTFSRGLYLSKAVREEGVILGVVVIKLPLNYIDRLLQETNLPAVLLSPDGVIFASTYQDWLYNSLRDLRSSILERLKKTKQFADIQPRRIRYDLNKEHTEIDGVLYNVYSYALKIDGWKLVVCNYGSEDLYLDTAQKRFIIVAMAFLALLSMVLVVVSYFLVKNRKSVMQISEHWHESEKQVRASANELTAINERLEKELNERAEIERSLEKKMQELERFNKVAIGREERIIELKKEVNALCRRLSKPDKYKSDYNFMRNNFEV